MQFYLVLSVANLLLCLVEDFSEVIPLGFRELAKVPPVRLVSTVKFLKREPHISDRLMFDRPDVLPWQNLFRQLACRLITLQAVTVVWRRRQRRPGLRDQAIVQRRHRDLRQQRANHLREVTVRESRWHLFQLHAMRKSMPESLSA